ncbi:site-specific DNA-methyltransferase [Candidatus Gracilibacteria bacterium]|nr:site-specific DNA-methyltransferase [Candidatus Gracilibacteria bacterium]
MKILNGEAILGDCFEKLKEIPSESIDMIITSPPYDNLRTYGGNLQWDFEGIAKEIFRVTKDGGVCVWVVGDSTEKFCESMTSFKQALFFKEIGFNLLDTMIYFKQNYAPAYPTLRRYANQFEYMFVFSKGKPKTFNPIQKYKARNKEEKVGFRQQDGTIIRKIKEKGRETKDASNVWEYAVAGGNKTGHPAVFPEKLAQDHILSWSNEGDIVLDPFAGSFTTAVACENTNRKWICIEKEQNYFDIGINRINNLKENEIND